MQQEDQAQLISSLIINNPVTSKHLQTQHEYSTCYRDAISYQLQEHKMPQTNTGTETARPAQKEKTYPV